MSYRTYVYLALVCSGAVLIAAAQNTQSPPQQRPAAAPQAPQTPPGGRGAGRGAPAGGGGFANAFPQRAPEDPAKVERGKAVYGVNCNFCHGSDARGGEGGPNLLRSDLVLNDQHGELIAPVVQKGRGEMPPISLTPEQISDVAAFIHNFRVSGYDTSRAVPPSILVGDPKAGETAFANRCAKCHKATDFKGLSGRFGDEKQFQNYYLVPGAGPGASGRPLTPITVTVTQASGEKVTGRLVRIDDFIVTLADTDNLQRSFRRDGDKPKVDINDPLKPHRDLLPLYSDKEIHNLTAYLVTLK